MKKLFYLLVALSLFVSGCSPSAQKYLSRGKMKYGFQDYRGAIFDFTRALEKNPGLAEAYFYRGLAKRNFNQGCVGISIGNTAVKAIAIRDSVFFQKGMTTITIPCTINADSINIMLIESIDTAGIPKAVKTYKPSGATKVDYADAVRFNTEDVNSLRKREKAKAYSRPYFGEIADYNKAIEIDPGYADAYYSRALAKIKFRMHDSACLDFKKAGELGVADAFGQILINCQ
jgi:tetratricopeptide (TPR) repeat protein